MEGLKTHNRCAMCLYTSENFLFIALPSLLHLSAKCFIQEKGRKLGLRLQNDLWVYITI